MSASLGENIPNQTIPRAILSYPEPRTALVPSLLLELSEHILCACIPVNVVDTKELFGLGIVEGHGMDNIVGIVVGDAVRDTAIDLVCGVY